MTGVGYIRVEPFHPEPEIDTLDTFAERPAQKQPQKTDVSWAISFRPKLDAELRQFTPPLRRIALADSLERAIETSDKFAEKKMGRDLAAQ